MSLIFQFPNFTLSYNNSMDFSCFRCTVTQFCPSSTTILRFFPIFVVLKDIFASSIQQFHAFSLFLLLCIVHFPLHGNYFMLFPCFCCYVLVIFLFTATISSFFSVFVANSVVYFKKSRFTLL